MMTTNYINTDLDITADCDLTPLVAELEAQDFLSLHCGQRDSGEWDARFEISDFNILDEPIEARSPEVTIAAMLPALEALSGEAKALWERSGERCFDMGYECGEEPWGFRQELSNEILGRIAALGMTLRITLYPHQPPAQQEKIF
jgi:hypothetical protein